MKLRKYPAIPEHQVAERVEFMCPGCGQTHIIPVTGGATGTIWTWNGSLEAPTFQPSILVTSGCKCPDYKSEFCWCNYEARYGKPPAFNCTRCHSFVRDGRIEFLSDCSHALAGQTVDLPEIEHNETH